MTKILQLSSFFLFMTLSTGTIASESVASVPAVKSELAEQRLLTDIVNVNGKLLTVGVRGHILMSTDGVDWQQANVPVNVLLTSIDFANDQLGYAVGHDATIIKTTDGGVNWTIVNYQPELDRPFLSVSANDDVVVATGAYGMYYESTDLGETWAVQFHDELLIEDDRLYLEDIKEFEPENYAAEAQYLLPHFNKLLITDNTWYLAGEAGFLARSENQGVDWVTMDVDYYGSFFGIAVNQLQRDSQATQLTVAGLRGNVFTGDESNWHAEMMPGKATLNSVLVTEGQTYLFGNSGNLYYGDAKAGFKHYIFEDGKAIMSGAVLQNSLILATEAGIKTMLISDLK